MMFAVIRTSFQIPLDPDVCFADRKAIILPMNAGSAPILKAAVARVWLSISLRRPLCTPFWSALFLNKIIAA